MLTTVAGLPAHPLLVHFAVVLTPISALLLLVTSLWPRVRRWSGPATPAVALVAFVACFLAKESGERFEKRVLAALANSPAAAAEQRAAIEHHADQGTATMIWAFVVFVLALAVWAVTSDWAREHLRVPAALGSRWPMVGLGVSSVVATIAAVWGVIAAGHSGASMVWSGL